LFFFWGKKKNRWKSIFFFFRFVKTKKKTKRTTKRKPKENQKENQKEKPKEK
jgi:hypothetical protein